MNEFDLRSFLYKNTLLEKKEDSKKGNKEEQKRAEGAIKDDEKHAKKLKKDARFQKEKLAQLKKDYDRDVKKVKSGAVKEGMGKSYSEDGDMKEEMENKKLTKEGLKDMIREKITSILNEDAELYEAEEVEVKDDEKVKVDIEKDVEIDDESSKSEIEVDSELAGESSDISAILGLLTKAQEEAKSLGDEKLMDQIGNTITFFTRKHVVQSAD